MIEDVYECIREAQRGDAAAMEKLVRDNDALVHYVVKRLKTQGREYEDLYQLGRLGLVRAVRNFDESYGVKFSTYAVPMIMGEIRRFLRDDGQMRVSRTIKENAKRALEVVNRRREETGSDPTLEEICAELKLSREDAVLALGANQTVRSLSEPLDGGDLRLEDTLGVNPFEKVEKNLLVEKLMASLDEKERTLLTLRYFKSLTQTNVAGTGVPAGKENSDAASAGRGIIAQRRLSRTPNVCLRKRLCAAQRWLFRTPSRMPVKSSVAK